MPDFPKDFIRLYLQGVWDHQTTVEEAVKVFAGETLVMWREGKTLPLPDPMFEEDR